MSTPQSSDHLLSDSFTTERYDSQRSFANSLTASPSSTNDSQRNQETPSPSNSSHDTNTTTSWMPKESSLESNESTKRIVQIASETEKEGNSLSSSPSDPCKHTVDSSNDISSSPSLHRHLNVLDLTAIGVGATIGSGIFVLCGIIAHDYAGPATFISWGLAGVCATASGLCYAELSGKMSNSGSSYSYVVSVVLLSIQNVIDYVSIFTYFKLSHSLIAWGNFLL